MKTKLIIAVLVLLAQLSAAQPDKKTAFMTYKGHYSGKNIFIKNQWSKNGIGFCVHAVKINGNYSIAEINAEIFEVALDLPGMNLKIGDDVTIEIKHVIEDMPRVTPTILNPGALLSDENYKNPKEDRFVIEGKFYHAELYVTNFYNTITKSHSIKQVLVNGKPFDTKLDRDILNLQLYNVAERTDSHGKKIEGYKEGDPLKIELVCEKGANPTFLNGDLITPFSN